MTFRIEPSRDAVVTPISDAGRRADAEGRPVAARRRAARQLQARAGGFRRAATACISSTPTGKRYLDFVSGIAVNALGYGDAGLRAAMHAAADGLIHVSNLYATAPGERLAARSSSKSFAVEGVLLQLGRGGERGRVQVRAPLGAHAGATRSTRSSRCAARFTAACSRTLAATDRPSYRAAVPAARAGHLASSSATSKISTPR